MVLRYQGKIDFTVSSGAGTPTEIPRHAVFPQTAPYRLVMVGRGDLADCAEKTLRSHIPEQKTAGAPTGKGRRCTINHRINQAACRMNKGRGTIALAVHLIQSAWFETGRHQETVRPGFDQMCKFFIKADVHSDFSRMIFCQCR